MLCKDCHKLPAKKKTSRCVDCGTKRHMELARYRVFKQKKFELAAKPVQAWCHCPQKKGAWCYKVAHVVKVDEDGLCVRCQHYVYWGKVSPSSLHNEVHKDLKFESIFVETQGREDMFEDDELANEIEYTLHAKLRPDE